MAVEAPRSREYWPTTGWQTVTPDSQGMDTEKLEKLQEFGDDPESEMNGFAIVRHGYLVAERYFRGFHPGSLQTLNSITKSVVATLVGIAIDRHHIHSVDQQITDWFPEIETLDVDPRVRRITLGHLLSMTSGWSHRTFELQGFGTNTSIVNQTLQRPLEHEPGTSFWYDNLGAHLTSVLLGRAVSQSPTVFAQDALFGPLGIWTHATPRFAWRTEEQGPHRFHRFALWDEQSSGLPWKVDPSGHSTGYAGLHLTIRDIAKFGYLWLNGGRWDGEHIVSAEYIADSISPKSPGGKPGDAQYGHFWWISADDPNQAYFGFGAGGQYVFVSPVLDLVVAIASSGTGQGGRHGDLRTRDIFDRLVIPAVIARP